MSRIRQVGGTYLKKVGGDYDMFASNDISFVAAKNVNQHGAEAGELYTNSPKKAEAAQRYFTDGFWGDEHGNKITEAEIGETVYFYILTRNIPEGEEVEFTLYDWDGALNPDDPVTIYYADGDKKGQPFTKAVVRDLGRARIALNLTEGLLSFIEEDAGDEIELYFECRYKGEVTDLPRNTESYLIVTEREEVVTVLIELPHSGYEDKLNSKGLGGHTAIMIGDEYYDYGPQSGEGSSLYSQGQPWWDQNGNSGNLTKKDMIQILENDFPTDDEINKIVEDYIATDKLNIPATNRYGLGISGKVCLIDIHVKESEKNKLEKWWQEKYNNLGNYSVWILFGEQCTTTVKISLTECTDVFSIFTLVSTTQSPEGFLDLLTNKGKHTCGKVKGETLLVTNEYSEISQEEINKINERIQQRYDERMLEINNSM